MSVSVVGFDIGSLNCCVAIARGGGIETVANEYSERITPTCVSFSGNMRHIGTSAKLQHVTNIKNTYGNFVQLVGKKYTDPAIVKESRYLLYPIDKSPDGRVLIPANISGERCCLAPEQLLAMQMTKLKEITENFISAKVVDVVINVPTYYTDAERRALLDASRIAGLNCVKLVNDLTAIGTAYGLYNTNLPAQDQPPKNVAFVSIGYTSTQVSICAFNSGKMKVLATASDPNLGGRDFDQVIFDQVSKEFQSKFKLNIRDSPKAALRLLQECEKLKKLMSANSMDLPLSVECLMDDRDFSSRMKRADFEDLSKGLFSRFESVLTRCITLSNVKPSDINSVELIGGSSRIPALKSLVASVFKQEVTTTLNADEAVARGCALQAAICSPVFRVKDFNLTDACPYSISLHWDKNEAGTLNAADSGETDDTMVVGDKSTSVEVFPMLRPIPSSRQISFNRRGPFTLEALYSNPNELFNQNTMLGIYRINNVPVKAGECGKIRVKARVNSHGIFTISQVQLAEEYEKEVEVEVPDDAVVPTSNENSDPKSMEVDTPSNGDGTKSPDSNTPGPDGQVIGESVPAKPMKKVLKKTAFTRYIDLQIDASIPQFSEKQVNNFCEYEASLIQQDRLERERTHSKNSLEEYVYEMRSKIQGPLNPFATDQEQDKLLKELDAAEDWLYGDGEDVSRQIYVDRLNELKSMGDPIEYRYTEYCNRPSVVDEFNRSLVHIRKVLDSVAAGEETYNHLTPKQIGDLQKHVDNYGNWLNQKMNVLKSLPKTSDPPVKICDILAQQQAMEAACLPIVNTPKPAPPPSPPQADEEVTNLGDPDSSDNINNTNTVNANGTGKKANANESKKAENMDLD